MADQYRGNVQLGLHFDGTDGATTTTELTGKTATFAGNAQIDTAQSKFGGSSLLLDGTTDWVSFADTSSLELGSGDYTMETWVRFNALPGVGSNAMLLSKYKTDTNDRSFFWSLFNDAGTYKLRLASFVDGTSTSVLNDVAWTPSTGTWYHVAVCRNGSSLRHFVDGTQVGSTLTPGNIYNGIATFCVGAVHAGTSGLNGWLEDIRVTKGFARYTANFTAPTAAFDDDGPTFAIAGTSTFTPESADRAFSIDGTSTAAFVANSDVDFAIAGTSDASFQSGSQVAIAGTSDAIFQAGSLFAIAGSATDAFVVHGVVTATTTIAGAATVSIAAFSDFRSRFNIFGLAQLRPDVTYQKFINFTIPGQASTSFKSSFESYSAFTINGRSLVQGRSPLQPIGYAFECAPQFEASPWLDMVPEASFRIRGHGKFRPRIPQGRCSRATLAGTSSARFIGRSAAHAALSITGSGTSSWVSQ